jgi:MutS domain V
VKVLLMHPDRDFDGQPSHTPKPIQFAQDLELGVLLKTAAAGDDYLYEVMVETFLRAWTNDIPTIRYRQEILKDCLANPKIVRQMYAIAVEPFGRERSWHFSLYGNEPTSMVGSAVRTLQSSLDVLRRIRDLYRTNSEGFMSHGFCRFFEMLERDLDDSYLEAAHADLKNLNFGKGVLLTAHVGDGGKGVNTMLRVPQPRDLSWFLSILTHGRQSHTLYLHPRDQAGAWAFRELKNRGLSLISDALYQSAEHVLGFLKTLRLELAFYIACLNLQEQLARIEESIAFPEVYAVAPRFSCRNLRDVCLALTMGRNVVGNDVDANGKALVIITGANRGGKSTFLRSVGLAQLMLQSGLFVTADSFASSIRSGLFTHYKRQEDRNMRSGKFDEELVRMSSIADQVRYRALVLFNESFAATHEQEGSEIARQIVSALLNCDITVFFVSHMYEFARSFFNNDQTLFLRADRSEGGGRDFRLREAKPLSTSYGGDLYQEIFEAAG